MADATSNSLESFLDAILRGSAKLLGCTSTTLVLINEKTHSIRVRVGTMTASFPTVARVEEAMGDRLEGLSIPLSMAAESLLYAAWRDQQVLETSSLAELVGNALQEPVLSQLDDLIGVRRFLCVPVITAIRNYGTLLLEKPGTAPFSRQQRQVISHYSRRVAGILENDLMGQRHTRLTRTSEPRAELLLFDEDAQICGQPPTSPKSIWASRPELRNEISVAVRSLLNHSMEAEQSLRLSPHLAIQLHPLSTDVGPRWLCNLEISDNPREASLEEQLLQLSLRDPAPSFFVDPELKITSYNDAASSLLGEGAHALIKKPVTSIFADSARIEGLLKQQSLDPDNLSGEEPVALFFNGRLVHGRLQALLLADADERVVGYLLLLRPSEASDEPQIEEQERLATMGEMATQLAHEIRNPLLAVGATLSFLSHDDNLPLEPRQTLATLAREIDRLDMLLRDYLTARNPLSFDETSLLEILIDAKNLLAGSKRFADRKIKVEICPSLTARVDYDALKHVFFNLLLNALEISPPQGEVYCRARDGVRETILEIDDQGPGLAAPSATCFKPFFTTKKHGTGLGLAVCRKIIAAHGGIIDLNDLPKGGCRAQLILPKTHPRTLVGQERDSK